MYNENASNDLAALTNEVCFSNLIAIYNNPSLRESLNPNDREKIENLLIAYTSLSLHHILYSSKTPDYDTKILRNMTLK